jgi:hypothetical protein
MTMPGNSSLNTCGKGQRSRRVRAMSRSCRVAVCHGRARIGNEAMEQ